MYSTTNPKGMQIPDRTTPGVEERRRKTRLRLALGIALWILGFLVLAVASFTIHSHPTPYPFEVQTTRDVQGLHIWPWIDQILEFFSTLNNPVPSGIALAIWLVVFVLFRWIRQGIFIVVTTMGADFLNFADNSLVARPRPSPKYGIHVDNLIPVHSFPSGHTEHDVAYYGFLLYLSFTKPVRQWRYRWVLIPFQVFAVVDILAIGYSRILEGEHWLLDVLAGYVSGALWMALFIFLYRWATESLKHGELGRLKVRVLELVHKA